VEARIHHAAVSIFGAAGWAGFNLDAVARQAGVGKGSLYLRWNNKEDLLLAALQEKVAFVTAVDTGSARTDLIELALQMLGLYLGDGGPAAMRLGTDFRGAKGVEAHFEALRNSQIAAARLVVKRGVSRGELPRATPITLLLDTLCGGAMMHAIASPQSLHRDSAKVRRYAEELVDFLVAAVVNRSASTA
jgi:AcrR family transcriptional regulator